MQLNNLRFVILLMVGMFFYVVYVVLNGAHPQSHKTWMLIARLGIANYARGYTLYNVYDLFY